ncbi:subtilisin family serine protease [Krasilnikovia cinnamomea]|uniref:alpha-amylase n=1 Tax=Krasilnikovia cinnamomea TaxID=349313 RepID=A0A4Q7ZGF2_9ACTN|nr:S8 family serine peptidase [Krasilnikovia cinnamomea]RZU49464.1 subtilisin family serine protease [Krasilnikovia cinnamomea]
MTNDRPTRRRWTAALAAAAAVTALATDATAARAADDHTGRPTNTTAARAAAEAPAAISAQVRAEVARGDTTFWVLLRDTPDLSAARRAAGQAKAGAVYRAATTATARHQAGLRALLTRRGARFSTYWISDTIRVTGGAALLRELAARPEVKAVLPDNPVRLPTPVTGTTHAAVQGTEWNIDRVGAPRVWNERHDRGEGIVVANVDTGVQYDHPALAAGYRGRRADGGYDHDYNWFDPAHICADPAPCDNVGHGTHTMGTMVGGEGETAIGVAPGASWIAVKGCETSYCSVAALLAAGQWIVAPTDRSGNNPRPDLAPDVVNNSWGGASGFDPWYSDVVRAWAAAGIFPAFSAGNSGPTCGTANTPGSYTATYASGAYDINNAIASFSSRGTGQDGLVKPNIAAPGVDVRSSVPGGGYAVYSGTSMASPHTAATVALLWSAVPALRRDIAATREVLDTSAIDVDDVSCGGTAGDNNVFGQGRLDAAAAVTLALSPSGSLVGTVTAGGTPLTGATVRVSGPAERSVTTGADGGYRFARLVAGAYRVRVTAFGYDTSEAQVQVDNGAADRLDADLTASASGLLTGTVTAGAAPVLGATVALAGTPVSVTTDTDGHFRIAAPLGTYQLTVRPVGGCSAPATRALTLAGDATLAIALDPVTDHYGHTCGPATEAYRTGDTRVDLTGDDLAAQVTIPFPFPLYGVEHSVAWVSTNGVIAFGGPAPAFVNTALPSADQPNDALYPFWDDLYVDAEAGVWTTADADTFVVEWRNVRFFSDPQQRLSISAILHRDGGVTYRYRNPQGASATGRYATIGAENPTGTDALAYSVDTAGVATDDIGVTIRPPAGRVPAAFHVTTQTRWGQNVYVVGDVPQLGGWDPARGVPLGAGGYPVWSGGVGLPAGTQIEFKYVIRDPDGTVTWEPGANRTALTPPSGRYETNDVFRGR